MVGVRGRAAVVVGAMVCGKMGSPLVGQELMDETLCFLWGRGWLPAKVRRNGFVCYEGAFPAVGIRLIEDNLKRLSVTTPQRDAEVGKFTSTGVRSPSLGDERLSSNETRFGLVLPIDAVD